MSLNEYVVETLVATKLAEAREAAARRALARRARVPGAFRAWLGQRLIALGEHVQSIGEPQPEARRADT
jgi:hypothetical protein